ncbi:MAG TPA: radical SAM protein [Desulfurococcales archaeon]|nr:radical SAM protein [Desulfurococcales archaeon]
MPFDPIELSKRIEGIVVRGVLRKYYRVARGGRWYGGIATADCVGCNLRCIFCWSGVSRENPEKVGKFYTPDYIYSKLKQLAKRRGYRQLRISGNEPTIGRLHLLKLLDLVEADGEFKFILETNGLLIGYDKSYARDLSKYKCLHVRVSIKGCTPQEFSMLTGAIPEAFKLQLDALKNLLDYGVSVHPAVMLSFSSKESKMWLIEKLSEIDRVLVEEFEEEYVFEYPHVVERLRKAGLTPKISFKPTNIPEDLI